LWSTMPLNDQWVSKLQNTGTTDVTYTAWAICGQPKGYIAISSDSVPAPAGSLTQASVTCPAGKLPLGGGVFGQALAPTHVVGSYPIQGGWAASLGNDTPDDITLRVYAVCAAGV